MEQNKDAFWQTKPLRDFTPQEWEAVCDGCGKCCLHKLEDIDSEKIYFTNVICRFFDFDRCQCSDYENRHINVPTCVYLTPRMAAEATWLPKTCGYRLLARGKDLPWWHPLVSGDPNSVIKAGHSVKAKAVSETAVDMADLEDMVVDWFD